MAENHLSGKVIGVAFDGTGYGTDGKIWGGEFLVADYNGFERRAHLRYVALPGGDAAVRQPWRMAMSYLRDTFGAGSAGVDLASMRDLPSQSVAIVASMLTRRLNCIDTSSCGRLFDAVSSIVGLRQEVTFEGQAAIELEMIADPQCERVYPYLVGDGSPAQLDMRPMIEAIVRDLVSAKPASEIAAAFHNTLAALVVDVCSRIRRSEALNHVCLSGGTFQNIFLLQRAARGLRKNGFEVFLHAKVPPNDGGIALGQAVISNMVLAAGDSSDN
jgi:hydrogenase maturation protein HypF